MNELEETQFKLGDAQMEKATFRRRLAEERSKVASARSERDQAIDQANELEEERDEMENQLLPLRNMVSAFFVKSAGRSPHVILKARDEFADRFNVLEQETKEVDHIRVGLEAKIRHTVRASAEERYRNLFHALLDDQISARQLNLKMVLEESPTLHLSDVKNALDGLLLAFMED